MKKSSKSHEYAVLGETLRQTREKAGVTQVDLAARLKQTQSYVSKLERGAVRLDFVQVRRICLALGGRFSAFVQSFEINLHKGRKEP
jgi:transcriptional regulator with XRE-family HTH domain